MNTNLQSLKEEARKEFDEQPWGVTRGVNIDVVGEIQGIEVPAREELKSFLDHLIEKSFAAGREDAVKTLHGFALQNGVVDGHGFPEFKGETYYILRGSQLEAARTTPTP